MVNLSNDTAIANASMSLGNDIAALRLGASAAATNQTAFARSAFAALLAVKGYTLSALSASILHAYGNPASPATGKPIKSVSGLRHGSFDGGQIVYQAVKSITQIWEAIDYDAPVTDDEGVTVGTGAIRAAVIQFVLDDTVKLYALQSSYQDALKAHVAATMPDNADAVADETAKATPDAGKVSQLSLNDRALAFLVAFNEAGNEERDAAYDTIGLIVDAMNAAIVADAGEEAPSALEQLESGAFHKMIADGLAEAA